jgi:type II secretory pathway component PulM
VEALMPLYTQSAFADDYSQEDIPANAASVRSATIDDAVSNLLTPSIVRYIDLDMAEKRGRGLYRSYDKTAAEGFMEANGLKGQFTFENREYNQLELSILAERKQKELKREAILSRADTGLAPTAGRLGLSLVTSLMDPLTVASAFIPVVGEARYGALLANAGQSVLRRAAVRAGVGVVEGAVGAAITEPIVYAAKRQEQADYTLSDSLLNIGVGGLFGGGLHAVGGALVDLGTASRRARIEARSAEIGTLLERRAVLERQADELNRPAPFTPLVESERILRADEIERNMSAIYQSRRQDLERATAGRLSRVDEATLREDWTAARKSANEINDTLDPEGAAAADQRLQEITDKLRTHETASLAHEELNKLDSAWNRAGTAQDRAKFLEGADGPMWRQLVAADNADNLEAVQRRVKALETERPQVESAMAAAEREKAQAAGSRLAETQSELANTRIKDAHRRMRQIDAELLQLRGLANDLTDKLKDVSRTRVLQADPNVREAALNTAVAQAVSDQPIDVEPIYSRPDVETLRASATHQADPNARPLVDPETVKRADQVLAEGESDDLAFAEKQFADVDAELKALQSELGDELLPEEVLAEIEAAAQGETDAREFSKAAQLLVICAARHAA